MNPFLILVSTALMLSCMQKPESVSPLRYDPHKPELIRVSEDLKEISGIGFLHGNNETVFAEEDEDGILYSFRPGSLQTESLKFGKKGDYEDLAICNDQIILLRSDGVLFNFKTNELHHKKAENVREIRGLLPEGEYEGLFADEKSSRLYILCKHCNIESQKKGVPGFIFQLQTDGGVTPAGNFNIRVSEIDHFLNKGRMNFHPSALAKNEITREWYILSSFNKILVITDTNWKVRAAYPLDPSLFPQPEGIAFDSQNNLYISNEGGQWSQPNILKFKHK